jgi:hypothetical protein
MLLTSAFSLINLLWESTYWERQSTYWECQLILCEHYGSSLPSEQMKIQHPHHSADLDGSLLLNTSSLCVLSVHSLTWEIESSTLAERQKLLYPLFLLVYIP